MTLTANSNGVVSGVFTIPGPKQVTAGTKLVEFRGTVSRAAATFVGRGTLRTDEMRSTVTITTIEEQHRDPLAQTFVLPSAAQVSAVDLWFTAQGAANVLVQIREVSLGVPTATVLAAAVKRSSELSLTAATRFTFAAPAVLNANQEYAIVIAGADATTAVATATIGEFDATLQRWVTSQPYQVGVLLSSSNASTWTPHQTKDLTFRLLGSGYTSTSKAVTLSPVSVANADFLIVMAAVLRPTAQTDVRFTLGVGAATYTVSEGQPVALPTTYTGTVTLSATLTGTTTISPTLFPDVHLVVGTRQSTGTYFSRLFDANGGSKVSVYYDAILPSGAAVAVAIERGDGGTWSAAPEVASTVLDGDRIEYRHEIDDFAHDNLRVRLTLTGTPTAIPIVGSTLDTSGAAHGGGLRVAVT
jgi:hypothetical protein